MRMLFRLFMWNDNGTTKATRTYKRRRVANILRANKWQRARLEVGYYSADGKEINSNAGVYEDINDLLAALDTFAEPELLEYLAA